MANIEEQMKICPHVTEQIFDYLDIRCLVKCRAISKSWKLFIEKSRFSWVKMIKAIVQQLQPSVEIQSQWNRFLLIADNKKIRFALRRLNTDLQDINKDFSPLFLLTKMKDSLELYKDICKTCKGDVFISCHHYVVQLIKHPTLWIPNFNCPNVRCSKVFFFFLVI